MGKLSTLPGIRFRTESHCGASCAPAKRFPSRGKRHRKLSRAIPGYFETLEGRQLMSLLGVTPGYPSLPLDTNGSTMTYTFNSSTQQGLLQASGGIPSPITISPGHPDRINSGAFTISFLVSNTGAVIAGQTGPLAGGNNIILSGDVPAITGANNVDLLDGKISQFGFLYTGTTTNNFDATFTPTGGALVSYFAGQSIGIKFQSLGNTFTGSFTTNWGAPTGGNSQGVDGEAGPVPTLTTPPPTINTSQQPATATVGRSIADQATVGGSYNPTGTVTFNLYGNPNGTGTPLFTDANESLTNGVATSTGYITTGTGTDYWVATYNSDDSNNVSVSSGTADEPVSITPATPAINTSQQPATATVGASIADQATVTGGDSPTGTVTFNLFSNPNGTGTPLFTDANVALVNGVATSTGYTATATGTDYWVATYNGDSNNSAVTSGTALEPVNITPATPAINTSQQPATATVGTSIADQATVTGGFNPTGTVTFDLYDNAAATGTPLFIDANVALVNGMATSTGYTAMATGTDYWVATYNGDSNNSTVTSGTADEPVSITPATPAINTTQEPASATVGTSIADQATVTGGDSPSGTVTFNLYDNAAATGTPLFTDANVALVNGVATSTGYTATATGTDYWVATYNGDSNNSSVTSGTADEPVSITPATPAINTTQEPATATVGTSIADQATVTGGFNPTGTVTFNLYSNSTGTGTPLFTDANVALVNGVATSTGYTATATGTDYWIATYNDDSNNVSVTSGTADEPVTITPATPAINTQQQPASATVGTSIADQATITGGFNPTGTVTFDLYNNPNGTGTPLFVDANVALVNGVATSTGYTATATGTDYWVATYNGDSNNSSVTSGTALEPVSITPATPAINTQQQPATATVGSSIADKATVTGGDSPTGTVTFDLYNNPNGTGTPLFVDANVALVNGVATSTGYTATATGTDYWVATYNGDSNNSAVTSGTALEPVSITPATPAINTQQQPATATVGSSIADKATVTGGDSPTGTVTFDLYNNPNGTGTPLFVDANVALVNGVATSTGYTATATGTDYWVATYNGDSNNSAVTSGTADEPVSITPATPAINTQQQPASATVGTSIADKATVTGGDSPSGTVTFNLYSNPNGTGTPLFTAANVTLVNGVATSPGYTATATGTDYWVATYNGDSNNSAVTSGTALEPVSITPATPAINTQQQPASATVGSSIADKATVTGGDSPSGTVTFNLYSNPNGTGTPLFTAANVALVNGVATSPGYTATATGTDYWVATYNGDSNNSSVTSGTALEPVSVTPATPAINTQQQPASATVGTSIADKATVTGGDSPSGTVTFNLYSNPNGTGTPLFTAANVTLVNGVATSPGYTATATGTDYWVATYNGDSNNSAVTSGTALEPVSITPATPAINTQQQPASATVGSSIADKATVTGGDSPSGTVTFNLYSNPNGTGTPLFTAANVTLVNGVATSPGYTATATGTDYWVATYNGDSNNSAVTSGTALEPVSITPATPAINTQQQPASATVGSSIADKATVTGGDSPSGTVTFNLYSNPNGTGTPLFTAANVTLVNGVATSPGYTATATGTDYWVATYNGDSNNSAVTSGTALEPVSITPAGPAIVTTPGTVVTNNGAVRAGEFATIGFWHNQNGQAVIKSFNGGATPSNNTQLGNWLATNFPHLFGVSNPYTGTSLAGLTNGQVAAVYSGLWTPSGLQKNTYVQAFAVALGIYADTTSLGGASLQSNGLGATYGFVISAGGGGSATFNVGSNGAAFGVANNTTLTVLQLLQAADSNFTPATDLFFAGNQTNTSAANNVLNGINSVGDIPGNGLNVGGGIALTDSATLSGAVNPTGNITFYLFAPGVTPNISDSNNVFSDTVTVSGNGTYTTAQGNNPGPYTPQTTGTYEWIAVYGGDSNNKSVADAFGAEPETVGSANPTINTIPGGTIVIGSGSKLTDTATLAAGSNPTGSITFTLYSPANVVVDTETVTVTGNGNYSTPNGFLPTLSTSTGTYQWTAIYSGDGTNSSVSSPVGDEPESVTPAGPAINTQQQPATATVGSSIADKATVTGGDGPTGSVTFKLYNNSTGTGTPLFTAANVTLVNGVATSPGYTATATGTDYWVATYNGDSNNSAVTSGTALEPVVITPAGPTINTQQQPATATVGSSIADKATVTGGMNPTGSVTFKLYSNPNGTGTPLFTAANITLVNGVATSTGYTATATGTDYWVATYNGDANNSSVTSGTALEPVCINPAAPAINTTPNVTSVALGTASVVLKDTATLSGGYNEGGSITFTLISPTNTTLDTETVNVTGNGNYSTPTGYTLLSTAAAGTYQWDATYNGDSNNTTISENNNVAEQVKVTTPSPIDLTVCKTVCDVQPDCQINCNFNGTPCVGGDYIWFNCDINPTIPSGCSQVTYNFTNCQVNFSCGGKSYSCNAPNSCVTYSSTCTTATETFDSTHNCWNITAPCAGLAGNEFLNGCEFKVPTAGLPGGIQNVCWSGDLNDNQPNCSANWQWGAACYDQNFCNNYSNLNVKPCDDTQASSYKNSDHCGTPEDYKGTDSGTGKSYLCGGATGGGGSNYTGSWSGTQSCNSMCNNMCMNTASSCLGDAVLYTVTVSNATGYANGTGIVLSDLLPTGVTFVSATTSQGSYSSSTGVWTIGAINSGSSAVLQVYAKASTYGIFVNTATVTSANQPDVNPNPTSSATLTVGNGISGTVFNDITGNGLSTDDTALSGVTVNLYKDLNGNGVLDSTDGAPVATVTVGANGFYSFTGLANGKYLISENVPTGYVETAPNLPTYYAVNLTNCTFVCHEDFDNFHTPVCPLNNVYYTIAGVSGTLTDLRGHTLQGETVTVHFTVPTTSAPMVYTLVSYNAPSAIWDPNVASQQTIYQMDSETLGPGTHTETVTIPNNFYQIDFVCGAAIDHLGAAGSNITYSSEGRLDSADNGGTCAPASVSGTVYVDYSNNGKCGGPSDTGVGGVIVQLLSSTGSVLETTTTNSSGTYTFSALSAGSYTIYIDQCQPALNGLSAGKDTVGTVNNAADGSAAIVDTLSNILLATGQSGIGYNFGQTAAGQTLGCGDTGSIAFWCSTNGQSLIKCLNGASTCTNLGNWLCSNFGNLFGSNCGTSNCSGKTNAQVCTIVTNLCNAGDSNSKCKAQAICAAINCYVTNSTLCGTVACSYGFDACAGGCGSSEFTVSCYGGTFGQSNNACQSLWQLLQSCNSQSNGGNCYNGSTYCTTYQSNACSVFTACNQAGNIGACV